MKMIENRGEEFSEWMEYAKRELKENRIEEFGFDYVLLRKALQEEVEKRQKIDESMRKLIEQIRLETEMKFRGFNRSEAREYIKVYIAMKRSQIR